ncbi:MAG: AAA family ATPase [Candidatus Heimdallarchaeota archaeon]|nr:AAA family ATPase [Candidatus Heimdallarchaeota archaeon]
MSDTIIIAVAGLPSSGKGTFGTVAEEFGFQKFVMGDVIRNECKKRNLEVNRKSSDFVMIDLRKEKGQDAVAVITLEWIQKALENGQKLILIDGVRSMSEIKYFRQFLPELKIIGIHANPQTRLYRALSRKRVDDAYSIDAFNERDKIELGVGIGDVIARSDYLIIAEDELEKVLELNKQVLKEILSNAGEIECVNC